MPTVPNASDPTVGFSPEVPIDQHTPATPTDVNIESPVEATSNGPAATPAVQDPFSESFAVETAISDSITSDTISQNQNALKLTSADLSHLTPLHDPSPDSVVHQTEPVAESPEAPQQNIPADGSSLESSIAGPTQATPSAEAESLLENSEFSVAESPAGQPAISDQRGFSILPTGAPPSVEPIGAAEANPQVAPISTAQEISNAPVPVDPQTSNETPNTGERATELRQPHNDESVSDEISRKADEILARLKNKVNLVTQEEQILSNIQEQQREVADSQLLGPEQQSNSIPEPSPHQDDSEMLIVNPNTNSPAPTPTPETFPMTDSPISSGRATRMDYEQLFDRLRDQTEENHQ